MTTRIVQNCVGQYVLIGLRSVEGRLTRCSLDGWEWARKVDGKGGNWFTEHPDAARDLADELGIPIIEEHHLTTGQTAS